MNKLVGYKINVQNQLYFYTLAMNENEINKSIYNSLKKSNIFRNKFNKRRVWLVH